MDGAVAEESAKRWQPSRGTAATRAGCDAKLLHVAMCTPVPTVVVSLGPLWPAHCAVPEQHRACARDKWQITETTCGKYLVLFSHRGGDWLYH